MRVAALKRVGDDAGMLIPRRTMSRRPVALPIRRLGWLVGAAIFIVSLLRSPAQETPVPPSAEPPVVPIVVPAPAPVKAPPAEVAPTPMPEPAPAVPVLVETVPAVSASDTLRSLWNSLQNLEKEIQTTRDHLAKAKTDDEKQQLTAALESLRTRQNGLRNDFEEVASGIDRGDYEGAADRPFNWQAELQDLLKPVLRELREATANTREIQALREGIAEMERRARLAETAVAQVAKREAGETEAAIRTALKTERESWQRRLDETGSQLNAARLRLAEAEGKSRSVLTLASDLVNNFFRTRGLNLLIAIAVFFLVLYLAKKAFTYLVKVSPFHRGSRSFYVRLIDLAYYVITTLGAFIAALVALYLVGDWLLLTLAVIFLVGILWALKSAVPSFVEQVKLMLNMGPVREGERVTYLGLPWKVGRIDVFTELTNPVLDGGHLRLPVKDLGALLSRPMAHGEPWFPCEKDHWVLLSDGVFGKVVALTPETVQVVKLGGNRRHYRTEDFLRLTPENLSKNFRVSTVFGIDYRHQEHASDTVPEALHDHLYRELVALLGKDQLIALSVELSQAGTSSLDFTVLADFAGTCASRYQMLGRALQRLCVEACNAHGWTLPFTQITLHAPPGITIPASSDRGEDEDAPPGPD